MTFIKGNPVILCLCLKYYYDHILNIHSRKFKHVLNNKNDILNVFCSNSPHYEAPFARSIKEEQILKTKSFQTTIEYYLACVPLHVTPQRVTPLNKETSANSRKESLTVIKEGRQYQRFL